MRTSLYATHHGRNYQLPLFLENIQHFGFWLVLEKLHPYFAERGLKSGLEIQYYYLLLHNYLSYHKRQQKDNSNNNNIRGQVYLIPRLWLYSKWHLHNFVNFYLYLPFVPLLFGSYSDMPNTIIYIISKNIKTQQHKQQLSLGAMDPLIALLL